MTAKVDVHPESGLPMIEQAGEMRVLAALPSTPPLTFTAFADHFELLPRSLWKPFSLRSWASARRNQRQAGACTGYGSTTAQRYTRKLAGLPDEVLSPFFVYGLINGGVDRGASVADTLTVLEQIGACREALLPELPQGTYQKGQYTQAMYKDAARFKVSRALSITSFEELGTALTHGLVCVTGIAVGRNFQYLTGPGVCPLPDVVIGGHALPIIGLENYQGVWCPEIENSWSAQWGDDGFAFLQEGFWDPRYGFPFDTYALLSPADDPTAAQDDPLT